MSKLCSRSEMALSSYTLEIGVSLSRLWLMPWPVNAREESVLSFSMSDSWLCAKDSYFCLRSLRSSSPANFWLESFAGES
jgi:hypothetical protein